MLPKWDDFYVYFEEAENKKETSYYAILVVYDKCRITTIMPEVGTKSSAPFREAKVVIYKNKKEKVATVWKIENGKPEKIYDDVLDYDAIREILQRILGTYCSSKIMSLI